MRQLTYLLGFLWALVACQGASDKNVMAPAIPDPSTVYNPYRSKITIKSNIDYPTGFQATLYDDRERDELASVIAEDGTFVMGIPNIAMNEVYFLKLTGERSAFGRNGLAWEERVPIYATSGSQTYELLSKPYAGIESVSKARFYIEGDGVQETLNGWQEKINNYTATLENEIAQQVTLGRITSTNKLSRRETLNEGLTRISKEFVFADNPNLVSVFLIYRQNDHRQQYDAYKRVYSQVPITAQQSKYGADLSRRFAKIDTPIDSLVLNGRSILADGRLMPLDTAALGEYSYWLLYFWSTRNNTSISGIPEIYRAIGEQQSDHIVPVFISVDEVFSHWRGRSEELGLEHSYLIRRESRQAMVNALYLDEVPRMLLIRPDGVVVEEDLDLQELSAILASR